MFLDFRLFPSISSWDMGYLPEKVSTVMVTQLQKAQLRESGDCFL